jgi:hypothetical protein
VVDFLRRDFVHSSVLSSRAPIRGSEDPSGSRRQAGIHDVDVPTRGFLPSLV